MSVPETDCNFIANPKTKWNKLFESQNCYSVYYYMSSSSAVHVYLILSSSLLSCNLSLVGLLLSAFPLRPLSPELFFQNTVCFLCLLLQFILSCLMLSTDPRSPAEPLFSYLVSWWFVLYFELLLWLCGSPSSDMSHIPFSSALPQLSQCLDLFWTIVKPSCNPGFCSPARHLSSFLS